MLRSCLVASLIISCGALADAQACTLLPPRFPAGSAEAMAEQRADRQARAEAIATNDLIFVGRVVAQRAPDLAEITAGRSGRFTNGIITDLASGVSEPYTFIPSTHSWFEPTEVLKGKADRPTTSVFSGEYGSSCGNAPMLKVGDEVLVFADKNGDYWIGDTYSIDLLPILRRLLK